MDTITLKNMLHSTAGEMERLAEQLEDEGRPMDAREKNLCRVALYPAVDEACFLAKIHFLDGDQSNMKEELDKIVRLVEGL